MLWTRYVYHGLTDFYSAFYTTHQSLTLQQPTLARATGVNPWIFRRPALLYHHSKSPTTSPNQPSKFPEILFLLQQPHHNRSMPYLLTNHSRTACQPRPRPPNTYLHHPSFRRIKLWLQSFYNTNHSTQECSYRRSYSYTTATTLH
jgi:hypothetical protein